MSHAHDLEDLHQITRARYEQRQQSFAKIVAEETHLRSELSRLDQMNRDTQTPKPTVAEMRAIGADVIWQGWLARAKTALNLKLARVLAVKEHHLVEVRRAYGKVLVVEELKKQLQYQNRKSRDQKALSDALTTALQNGPGFQ